MQKPVICLLLLCLMSLACCGDNCISWNIIEEKLKQIISSVSCHKNPNCSLINCNVEKFGLDVKLHFETNLCEVPPSIVIGVDSPVLNIHSWNRKFIHDEVFPLPANFTGNLKMDRDSDKIKINLSIKTPNFNTSSIFKLLSPKPNYEYHFLKDIVFYIPKCLTLKNSTKQLEKKPYQLSRAPKSPLILGKQAQLKSAEPGHNCSIYNSTCPENELCRQLTKSSPNGICVCLPDYVRDLQGKCIFDPSSTTTTTSTTTTETTGNTTASTEVQTSTTKLALEVFFGLLASITLLAGLVFVTIRFRVFAALRRRFRVQVYEHVLLGDDDDELQDDSTNPVA